MAKVKKETPKDIVCITTNKLQVRNQVTKNTANSSSNNQGQKGGNED